MTEPVLVVIFLRGGADGLHLICPSADTDLIAARAPDLRVARKGDKAGFVLQDQAADVDFRFHPQAKGLSELFGAGELAVVHAAGLTDGTRSHFDAEDKMERASAVSTTGGWLGRWLANQEPDGPLPALAVGDSAPESLRGGGGVPVAGALDDLILPAGHELSHMIGQSMMDGFAAHPLIGPQISKLVGLSGLLSDRLTDPDTGERPNYRPDVKYPKGPLAQSLQTIAHALKLDLGLRIATADYGGWDTHINQAGDFAKRTRHLSQALMAFWRDLGDRREHVTVVVMSEFGRRLRSNTAGGTDHGYGNAMMIVGGNVKGGQMLGAWPGLQNEALAQGADLAITTDYRQVLAEVLRTHMKTPDLSPIFPDFADDPLGLFA
ncbi:DUF1501 domain-containing protein [Yoonia sp. SS1-5]|uniref:DUF1501 domain-containing protein n=1 Tax=Yoonia rhodophyticola TaxID=3137370 RepID=A0AAN0MA57_9RHOB